MLSNTHRRVDNNKIKNSNIIIIELINMQNNSKNPYGSNQIPSSRIGETQVSKDFQNSQKANF